MTTPRSRLRLHPLPVIAVLAAASFALIAGLMALPAAAASGASPRSLGKFGAWEAFVDEAQGGKVCYTASLPKDSKNAPKSRGQAYAMVSHRPSEKTFGVVGITAGYPLKKGAAALLEAGGTKFDLYTVEGTAWSRDDKAVLAAFAKAKNATFIGYPAKGEAVADVYALDGFSEARAAIDKACGAK